MKNEEKQPEVIIASRAPELIAEVHRQLGLPFEDLGTVYLSRSQWEVILKKVVELKNQQSN